MEEIKMGDWIRDREGTIIKVNYIEPDEDVKDIWYKEKTLLGTWKSMIVKHSKNLIDLIEVGDYVNYERILDITGEYIRTTESIHNKYWLSKNIRSIVTKEQFANIEYRIEDR